ncbi:unnamed protein product [Ceratitis capitata]|uniref:(Mediterranean fruit fly) hypothetical protein n=1 Tax=Ceratitis capitata TaxID=7213 RepID=A0A811U4I6_CERCA|nr:unnamed protein product [Ceratitis capitata]
MLSSFGQTAKLEKKTAVYAMTGRKFTYTTPHPALERSRGLILVGDGCKLLLIAVNLTHFASSKTEPVRKNSKILQEPCVEQVKCHREFVPVCASA